MNLYSSKTPRDLNHDPYPSRNPYDGSRWVDDGGWAEMIHDPRPEFDHVQHNEPNPILLDIRAHRGATSWEKILWAVNLAAKDAGHYIAKDWTRITDSDQINHAVKVLERLARLSA